MTYSLIHQYITFPANMVLSFIISFCLEIGVQLPHVNLAHDLNDNVSLCTCLQKNLQEAQRRIAAEEDMLD